MVAYKRYLVFAGNKYYPYGGMRDFRGSRDLLDEAKELALTPREPRHDELRQIDWANICDMTDSACHKWSKQANKWELIENVERLREIANS